LLNIISGDPLRISAAGGPTPRHPINQPTNQSTTYQAKHRVVTGQEECLRTAYLQVVRELLGEDLFEQGGRLQSQMLNSVTKIVEGFVAFMKRKTKSTTTNKTYTKYE
jgi:hypothetical protein